MINKILSLWRKLGSNKPDDVIPIGWSGDFTSWEDAKLKCSGYDDRVILEKCKNSLLQVKNGDAVYERDSVLFDEVQYNWSLLSVIRLIAEENENTLSLVDFGGSLGSSYFQNKELLSDLKRVSWSIIEQQHFVECGKEYFQSEDLKFYFSIEDSIAKHSPKVLLLSCVLPYVESPFELLAFLNQLRIDFIILDRTPFINFDRSLITIQRVPPEIYDASYPAWFFNKKELLKPLTNYKQLTEFDSYCDADHVIATDITASWSGMVLQHKDARSTLDEKNLAFKMKEIKQRYLDVVIKE